MKKVFKIIIIAVSAAAAVVGVIAAISVYRSKFRKKYVTICE